MKKVGILIFCLFVILSVDVAAQLTSLSQLPTQKRAITLGYANHAGTHYARFDVENSFTDRTKSAVITELGFFSSADDLRIGINSYYQVVHLEPLSTTLDYFFVGSLGFRGEVVSAAPIGNASGRATFDQTLKRVSVGGGGGILLKTMGSFKPFVGVTYNRYFAVSEDSISKGLFSILPGFDFDISSRIGAVGQVVLDYEPGFGFYDGGIFFIGLRFH